MGKPFVAILMGSDSDLPMVEAGFAVLEKFAIRYEVKVTSAHRTPEATAEFVRDADARGCVVFICAAGMAAHLAGAVAAMTLKPVIGIPIDASLNGLDSLLSTVQMPAGIPVATVAIGKAGAKNAWIKSKVWVRWQPVNESLFLWIPMPLFLKLVVLPVTECIRKQEGVPLVE